MAVSLGFSGLFRVRMDLSEINLAAPVAKLSWILVDPLKLRTIADLREVIRLRSKLPDDQAIELYVQDALLPDEESILLLRDGDNVKVVPGFRPLPCLLQAASRVVSAVAGLVELDDSVDELGLKRKSHPLCKKEKRKRKKEEEPEESRSIEKIRNHIKPPDIKDAHYPTKLRTCHGEPDIVETDKQKHGHLELTEPINQEQGNTVECFQKLSPFPPANIDQTCHEVTNKVIEEPEESSICEVNEVIPIPITTGVPKRKRNRRKKHKKDLSAIEGCTSFGNGDKVMPQTFAASPLFRSDAGEPVKNKHIIFGPDDDILIPEPETVATLTTSMPRQKNLLGADNAVAYDFVTSVADRLKQAEKHSSPATSMLPHSSFVENSRNLSAEVLSDGNVTANKSLNGPFKQLSKSQQLNSTLQNVSTIYTNIDNAEKSTVKGKCELPGKQVAEKDCDSWIPLMGPPQTLINDAHKQNSVGHELPEVRPVSSNHEKLRLAPEDYIKYPLLKGPPRVGDLIAYKILQLSASYCPEESGYKEGKVVKCDPVSDVIDIELFLEMNIKPRSGKFELAYVDDDDDRYIARSSNVSVPWSSMIEPRLLSV